jgi:hypothetical protein
LWENTAFQTMLDQKDIFLEKKIFSRLDWKKCQHSSRTHYKEAQRRMYLHTYIPRCTWEKTTFSFEMEIQLFLKHRFFWPLTAFSSWQEIWNTIFYFFRGEKGDCTFFYDVWPNFSETSSMQGCQIFLGTIYQNGGKIYH